MSAETRPLQGQVALVTGAGRGIGRGCVAGLAAAGAEVIAIARSEADLDGVRADCGDSVETWAADVTDPTVCTRIEGLSRLDILVNNAGTNKPQAFAAVDSEALDVVIGLNVRAAFLVAQAAVRVMLRTGAPGSVIHMSSQMGHVGSPNRSVYCMTKHAIEGLTKAMAVELAPVGIRVNSVAPTFIETPLVKPMLADPEFRDFVQQRIPLGRAGEIDDVVRAVLFLADPRNSMITGHSLRVDGGWTAQ